MEFTASLDESWSRSLGCRACHSAKRHAKAWVEDVFLSCSLRCGHMRGLVPQIVTTLQHLNRKVVPCGVVALIVSVLFLLTVFWT